MINIIHLKTLLEKTLFTEEDYVDYIIDNIKNKKTSIVDECENYAIFYYLYWGKACELLGECQDIKYKDFYEELLVYAVDAFNKDNLYIEIIIQILDLMSKLDCVVDYSCGLNDIEGSQSNTDKILNFYFSNCKNMLLEFYVEFNTEMLYKYKKKENIFELILTVFFNRDYEDNEDSEYIFNDLLVDIESYKLDVEFKKKRYTKTEKQTYTNLFKNNYDKNYFNKNNLDDNKLLLDFLTYLTLADYDSMNNSEGIDIDINYILNHLENDLMNNTNSRFINCIDTLMPYLMSLDQESVRIFYNYDIFTVLYFQYVHNNNNSKNFYPEILKSFKIYLDEYKWNEENRFNQIAVDEIDELYDEMINLKCNNHNELFAKLLLTHNIMLDCHYEKKIIKKYMKCPNKLYNYILNECS